MNMAKFSQNLDKWLNDNYIGKPLYYKMHLLHDTGRCSTCQGDLHQGLSMLQQSLEIVQDKMSYDLHTLVLDHYNISYNLLIAGKVDDALDYINRAVVILDENEVTMNFISFHQQFVVDCKHKAISSSLLRHHYRFRRTLSSAFESFPDDDVTIQVVTLLDDMMWNV